MGTRALRFGESLLQDLRIAFRSLSRSPVFFGIAVVSLALGIGANTAIFSFVNAILLKRLTVPEPQRLVTFAEKFGGETRAGTWRIRTVDELAKRNSVFDGVFGWFSKPVSFSRGKFRQGGGDIAIVGVVQDARDRSLRLGPMAGVYLPVKQMQTSGLTLLVRAGAKPTRLIPSLMGIVGNIDRRMPVYSVHTLDVQMDAGLSSERILGYLSVMFAALATLLAGIGLYGVMAYLVAQRTREIGIRLSTGAQRRDIAHLFARESAILTCVGVAVGVPLAIISSSGLRAVLFGVTTSDPVTLTISVAALLAAAAIATAYPVIKAAQTSPMAALRYE